MSSNALHKHHIAASFSRAAPSYDAVAGLQRAVGKHLMECIPSEHRVDSWLDLGSGTGYFSRSLAESYPKASGIALDLAEGMLRYARPQGGAQHFICADAECLPIQGASCDLIFSSLALQWCSNFSRVLEEAHRVLKPGGILAFSSVCAGTLWELRDSWRQVDDRVHVNRFRPLEVYQALCEASPFSDVDLHKEARILFYPDVRGLTHELKALGAHNLNEGRPESLTGRERVRALVTAYEGFRQEQGLPASWQLVYGVLRR